MELKNFQIIASIKVTIKMVSLREQEVIIGLMVNITMDNGLTDSNMVQVCGEVKRETHIKASGNLVSLKDMECIHGQTEIIIRDNLRNV
jgi:hypothetical protein